MCVCVCVCVWVNALFLLRHAYFGARVWALSHFGEEAKQNKTRQKIFANTLTHTHTYTTNVFQKYCLIWKVLRRSSHMCFFTTHKHTISRSINLRARVLSVSMAFTPHSICLPPSLSHSFSIVVAVGCAVAVCFFFILKKGMGALHYKNLTYVM